MPELPEVETVRRGLQRLTVGLKVVGVTTYESPRSFPNSSSQVDAFAIGAKVTAVRRRAKVLLIDLSTEYTFMIHLKMTGQLVFVGQERFGAGHPNGSLVGKLPDRSTR
ncbi:MAG: DNA-formamidopyrimidine glycosylase family protein, partial [Candidatus Saccharimonas sp.]